MPQGGLGDQSLCDFRKQGALCVERVATRHLLQAHREAGSFAPISDAERARL